MPSKKKVSIFGINLDFSDYKKRYLEDNVPFIRNHYQKLKIPYNYKVTTDDKGKNWDTRKIYPDTPEDFKNKFFKRKKPIEFEGIWQLPGMAKVGLIKEGNSYQSYMITFNKRFKISQMSYGKFFSSLFTDHGVLDFSIMNGTKNARYYKTKNHKLLRYSGIMTNISWKDSSEKLPINFLVDYDVEIIDDRTLRGSIPGMEKYEDFQPITLYKVWPELARQHTYVTEREREIIRKAREERNSEKDKGSLESLKKDDVKKESNPGVGSGFFISDSGHIVTNFHVVADSKDIKVQYENDEIKAKVLATDQRLDLALIKIDKKNNDFVKFSNKSPFKSQEILVAGFPFGKAISDDLKITGGIINSLKGIGNDSTRFQLDATINTGNSGGPIVDKVNGSLVGVAVEKLNKDGVKAAFGTDSENTNYGIKASQVRDFLESNNIKVGVKKDKFKVSELEEATIFVISKRNKK